MLAPAVMPAAAKLSLALLVLASGCAAADDVALARDLCGEFRTELRSELEWISWLEQPGVDQRREGLRRLDRDFAGPWPRLGLRVCIAAGTAPPAESVQAEWSQAVQALGVELIRISTFLDERPLTPDERAALEGMARRLADVYAALAGG